MGLSGSGGKDEELGIVILHTLVCLSDLVLYLCVVFKDTFLTVMVFLVNSVSRHRSTFLGWIKTRPPWPKIHIIDHPNYKQSQD